MKDRQSDSVSLDRSSFLNLVTGMAGEDIQKCYQCIKCAAGCPIAEAMDYLPNQIIRMIQLGLKEDVLTSSTIWLCASCETCAVRCPMQLDLARVMDSLREIAIKEDVSVPEKNIAIFHREFLSSVRNRGRVHEFSQLVGYKMKAKELFSDIGLGMRLLAKGRLALKPSRVDRVDQVQALFEVTEVRSD
ncbi:MAG: 4Fe-4S dicluster domain-containing protein [Anaerolineae bacterium]